MKITECEESNAEPICVAKGKEFVRLIDWLYTYHKGRKFSVIIDTQGSYPIPEKEYQTSVKVFPLENTFDELVRYIGIDEAQKRLDVIKERKKESVSRLR